MEAEPSESPSFWICNTQIRYLYTKVGAFWLPKENTTVTRVRLGGTTTLTIDFEKYEFATAANRLQRSEELEQANSGSSAFTQLGYSSCSSRSCFMSKDAVGCLQSLAYFWGKAQVVMALAESWLPL